MTPNKSITDITTDDVIDALLAHHPNALRDLADTQTLRECLGMPPERAAAHIRARAYWTVERMHKAVYSAMMVRD